MVLTDRHITILQDFFKSKPVLRAYLFGSQARKEADLNSDVDILVDLDYEQKVGWEFVTMQIELSSLLKTKVDLVSSRGMSPFIGPFIELEKLLIYDRDKQRQGAA